ncbi:hypothetical protein ASPACDRAFT_37833 [Aspergillus aculeatus ATCC 16872]|uniref:Uncharacterized protein n=1 Tax=Aspergillus aculeatus (strain ATCC 16872 / CBS 172.66 / WB 5094) TaxID=690307 RepID=A0A1L9X773_ASPA1|nr:uncharacterized protein ASPACDRAFT_37833 [Aspergillus aculeatus ATCC 16872]OJK04277.1 hypothetical protein ASPACDRAFT_37833 [Aspergillus aculeatus ATCC 16872]
MSDDVEQTFAEVAKATKSLKAFPYVAMPAHRLHNKARLMLQEHFSADRLQVYVDRAGTDPAPNPNDSYDEIFFIYDLFIRLSIPAVSDGIANLDSKDDPQSLGRYLDKSISHLRYPECTTNRLGSCLLKHINRDLNDRQSQIYSNGDSNPCAEALHLFSITWLLIADYMQDEDAFARPKIARSSFSTNSSLLPIG